MVRKLARVVERSVRIREVEGSNPFGSTTKLRLDAIRVPGAAFFFIPCGTRFYLVRVSRQRNSAE